MSMLKPIIILSLIFFISLLLASEIFNYKLRKKWDDKKRKSKNHQHKCPDCGIEFDCPCGKSCGVEYNKYPCIDHIMNHCIKFSSTKEGAEEL